MDFGIKGKSAIVTAASSGLGKASAMELAAEGARVMINARDAEKLTRAAEEIRAATRQEVLALAGDVTDEGFVRELVAETNRTLGAVDILVANAGGPPAGFFDDFSAQDYRDAVELNLISTINLCREATGFKSYSVEHGSRGSARIHEEPLATGRAERHHREYAVPGLSSNGAAESSGRLRLTERRDCR